MAVWGRDLFVLQPGLQMPPMWATTGPNESACKQQCR